MPPQYPFSSPSGLCPHTLASRPKDGWSDHPLRLTPRIEASLQSLSASSLPLIPLWPLAQATQRMRRRNRSNCKRNHRSNNGSRRRSSKKFVNVVKGTSTSSSPSPSLLARPPRDSLHSLYLPSVGVSAPALGTSPPRVCSSLLPPV